MISTKKSFTKRHSKPKNVISETLEITMRQRSFTKFGRSVPSSVLILTKLIVSSY